MEQEKQVIIAALYAFVNQRGGIDPRNYGGGMEGWRAYRAESRSVTRDGHDARRLLRQIELRDSITAADLKAAFPRAFSGRLTLVDKCARYDDGSAYYCYGVDYCTGQYFPTEYRKAVAAVCASALWDRKRADMPAPFEVYGNPPGTQWYAYKPNGKPAIPVSAGDWIRRSFRREFGPRLARCYFD